jgi:hypothetical protein
MLWQSQGRESVVSSQIEDAIEEITGGTGSKGGGKTAQ